MTLRALLLSFVTMLAAGSFAGETQPLTPDEALKSFTVPDDLVLETVLTEPQISQPVFLNFDERGRMWVVEYRQYPHPAGLKIVSHDSVWRAVYDKMPEPPPKGVPGKDRISIHEDTNGDGTFDKHSVFVDGLNIVSAVERGRGGVWVLNPPYLLYYADANNDDVPDAPPEVKLQGFGLEDTHSVVNSLRWGPDGWLYGAQGSTVTGAVRRPDQTEAEAVRTMGQNIWRYHPESKRYEVFAEGGGNAFYVELDAQGRIFSGHNGGDTRGFHYVQGGYLRKGFDKHGPLSNPYAFGYFPEMKHAEKVARFTHGFLKYEGGAFPQHYNGRLFAIDPLNHVVFNTELIPQGATFSTRDVGSVMKTSDKWFRPVDIKLGPDGAVYIADWYDFSLSHLKNAVGEMEMERGRIYRLRAKNAAPTPFVKPGQMASYEVAGLLTHSNRWVRQTALRVIAERKADAVILQPRLQELLKSTDGTPALEALWASYQLRLGGLALLREGVAHADASVRQWAVRLACDDGRPVTPLVDALKQQAQREENIEVRGQLAASARRLSAADSLAVLKPLLARAGDAQDAYVPLQLWWSIEAHCEKESAAVLDLFADAKLWQEPLVQQHILERLMRRLVAPGTDAALQNGAKLFAISPGKEQTQKLLAGFEKAFEGRALPALPKELIDAMVKAGAQSLFIDIRLGKKEALEKALLDVANAKTKPAARMQLVQVLGEVKEPRAVPVLLDLALKEKDAALRRAAIAALQSFDDARVPETLLANAAQLPPDVATAAFMALSGRGAWTGLLLGEIEKGAIKKESIAREVVDALKQADDPALKARIEKLWKPAMAVDGETRKEIERVKAIVAGGGEPKKGQVLYTQRCAACHQLFGAGGHVGPDLTSFKRDDLETMLINIVNPSAEIREGFVNSLVKSKDGRSVMGIVIQQSDTTLTLRSADGQDMTFDRAQIKTQKALGTSLMPEGLLEGLSDEDLKHLFAFLRSTQPPK